MRIGNFCYIASMSLESIFRVVSHALKSAAEQNGGTPDEKAAMDVLGGLTALLESRVQLHRHASPAPTTGEAVAAAKPKLPAGPSNQQKPGPSAPDDTKRRTPDASGDSYDVK